MSRTILAAAAILLAGGCSCSDRPPPDGRDGGGTSATAPVEPRAEKTPIPAHSLPDKPVVTRVEKPADVPALTKQPSSDYQLPLEIHVDSPEVPKEIMGPSPPIPASL
jgi:hypothetical protein